MNHITVIERYGSIDGSDAFVEMAERGVIVSRGPTAPSKAWAAVWYYTHDGLGWLHSHGMDAVREACIWTAEEAQVSS